MLVPARVEVLVGTGVVCHFTRRLAEQEPATSESVATGAEGEEVAVS